MRKTGKIIEMVANIAIIVVAILLGTVLVRTYLYKPQLVPPPSVNLVGAKVSVSEVDWTKSEQTLVLALNQDCHFCTESAAFYQKIAKDESIKKKTRLLAVFPHSAQEGEKYLNKLGVPTDDIDLKQVTLSSIRVRGTPTLMLVNSQGLVIDAWLGKLSLDKESEALKKLQ
jgi:hypothetical protein